MPLPQLEMSVSILSALRWVALAWNEVKIETISKCFKKAGVLAWRNWSCCIEWRSIRRIDEAKLQTLMEQTEGTDHCCSPQQFVTGDDDLPICMEMDDENWEATFLEELVVGNDDNEKDDGEDNEGENDDATNNQPPPKVMTYNDALDNVCQFLEEKGHGDLHRFIHW